MKMPSRTPSISAPQLRLNGLNQSAVGLIDADGWPVYTLISATTANSANVKISRLSRAAWMRAESSMPRYQIQVMMAIQATAPRMIAQLCGWPFQSANVYWLAIAASEAMTM